MLFLLLIAKKLVAASGRKETLLVGCYRPEAVTQSRRPQVAFRCSFVRGAPHHLHKILYTPERGTHVVLMSIRLAELDSIE